MKSKTKHTILAVITCALLIASYLGYLAGHYASRHSITLNNYGNPVGGSFRLMDSTTGTMTDTFFTHQWLVVLFGAIHCAHNSCSQALTHMGNALNQVDPHKRDMLILFVSLDPNRDDPGHMRQYVNHFPSSINTRILMGSASPRALADLTREYHTTITHVADPEWHYSTQMSPTFTIMGPHMRYQGSISSKANQAEMVKQLNHMIENSQNHDRNAFLK